MPAPLLKLLHQPSCIPLLQQTDHFYKIWWEANNRKLALTRFFNKDAIGISFKDYATKKLAQQNNVSQLSTLELFELNYAFLSPPTNHLSLRIILCHELTDHSDVQPGDTIVTSERVWQIHTDLKPHVVLNKKEMDKSLPSDLRPKKNDELRIIKTNDGVINDEDDESVIQAKQLTTCLNSALKSKPSSLYIAQHHTGIVEQTNQILRSFRQEYLEKEISKRQPLQHIFNILGLQSSYQLIQFSKNIEYDFSVLQHQDNNKKEPYSANDLVPYILGRLRNDIAIQDLSDEELKILHLETYSFMLPLSTRLFLVGSVDTLNISDRKNGDTYLTSDGMWQQDATGTMQLILNKDELRRVMSEGQMPAPSDPLQIIDLISPAPNQQMLINQLNQAIADKPHVLYLGAAMCKEYNQTTNTVSAINGIAEEEMVRRNLLTPFDTPAIPSSSRSYNTFLHVSFPKNFFGIFRSDPSHSTHSSSVTAAQRLQHVQQDLKDKVVHSADTVLVHSKQHSEVQSTFINRLNHKRPCIVSLLLHQSYSQVINALQPEYMNWASLNHDDNESFATYTANILTQDKAFNKLTLSDLIRMHHACNIDLDTLPHSQRLIVCASKKKISNVQTGDTIMTPEGVWQIDSQFQEHLVLDSKGMQVIPKEFIPTSSTEFTAISTNDTHSTSLISHLNAALVKKKDALYLGTEDTTIIHEAIKLLNALKSRIEQRIATLRPEETLLRTLNLKNTHDLYLLVIKINNAYLKSLSLPDIASNELQKDELQEVAGVGADEEVIFYREFLHKTAALQNLSDKQLQILQYVCRHYQPLPTSERIIVAASLSQLEDNIGKEIEKDGGLFQLIEGDTVVLPNAVYQYTSAQKLQKMLQMNEMKRHIPGGYIPNTHSDFKILYGRYDTNNVENVDAITLSQALNKALGPYSNAYFIGNSQLTYRTTNTLAQMSDLATNKINRRKLKTNFIFKALLFNNDAEFIHFWERTRPDTQVNSTVEIYTNNMMDVLQKSNRINFANLSDTELQILGEQCDTWSPNVSSRILCCHTMPTNYQIGDTILLPDGIFQMQINSSGKIIQERIMDQATMKRLDLLKYLPTSETGVIVHNDYHQDLTLLDLKETLNPFIIKHPKGMYLSELEGSRLQPFSAFNAALKNLAVAELQNRALKKLHTTPPKRFYLPFQDMRLFQSSTKVKPISPKLDMLLQPAPAVPLTRNIKDLQSVGKRIKNTQKALKHGNNLISRVEPSATSLLMHSHLPEAKQRTFEDIKDTIEDVAEELSLTLIDNLTIKENRQEGTIKILHNTETILETSARTLAVYKPLLQTDMDNDVKAALFLKALGIPPTEGKDRIEVQGGNHDLRKTIRKLFKQMKKDELNQEDITLGVNDRHPNKK